MKKEVLLSIIIVNYKNYKLTKKCIYSVLENVKNIVYEIIVIDNDSPNESYEMLSAEFKDYNNIYIIKNNINSGFGAANNLGVDKSKGEYILLLNPDVIVLDDAIEKLLDYKINHKDVGLVSGKLLNDDYSVQHSCRRIISLKKFLICRTPISKVVPTKTKERINDEYLMSDFNHDSTIEVDWVMGACMLMQKDEFKKLGGFSKEYFMYFEDVDLCYKVKKSGKKVIYLHDAKMVHLHKQESSKKLNKMSFIHLQSMMKFYCKLNFKKF